MKDRLTGVGDYLYHELDKQTRTLRVRLVFNNKDEYLKPNMYAYVSIINEHTEPVMHIDRQALIMDGRMTRVIVAVGDGRFEPREVKVGMVNDTRAEILEGPASSLSIPRPRLKDRWNACSQFRICRCRANPM